MSGSEKSLNGGNKLQAISSDRERLDRPAALESNANGSDKYGGTQRGLKSRHVQFIALGGCIGTGLFVGTGATLSVAGGANMFMAFVVMSVIIWSVMNSLAEMTTYLPVSGVSVPYYVVRLRQSTLVYRTLIHWLRIAFSSQA